MVDTVDIADILKSGNYRRLEKASREIADAAEHSVGEDYYKPLHRQHIGRIASGKINPTNWTMERLLHAVNRVAQEDFGRYRPFGFDDLHRVLGGSDQGG